MTDINELADKVRAAKAALDAFVPKHELEDDYHRARQALLDAVVSGHTDAESEESASGRLMRAAKQAVAMARGVSHETINSSEDWVVKPDVIDATDDDVSATVGREHPVGDSVAVGENPAQANGLDKPHWTAGAGYTVADSYED